MADDREVIARGNGADIRHAMLAIVVALACGTTSPGAAPEPADFVLTGGRVVTLDPRGTVASAVAIRDGRLVHVGDDAGAIALVGPRTVHERAGGRTVIPGLNETHVHPTLAARAEVIQPFIQLRSIGEIQDWVRARVAGTPADEWIVLPRVDVTRIREGRLPSRADLDAAAADRPVVSIWQYANRQVQVLNSAALRVAGIDRDTRPPEKGRIEHDAAGEPTGRIEDAPTLTERWLAGRTSDPGRWIGAGHKDREAYLAALGEILRRYAAHGITSIADRYTDADGWKAFHELRDSGRLPVRAVLTINLGQGVAADVEQVIRGLPFGPGEGDDWVRIGPLKTHVDGGVLYGTSYLREPYGPSAFALYGFDDPAWRGRLQLTAEQLGAVVRAGHRLGWPMCAHVTGDAGVDMVLDAVEAARRDASGPAPRFTLLHAYFPHEDMAARCARLGVGVDTQPAWYYKDADALAAALGGARMERFIGLKVWRDAGVTVAINADHFLGFDPDRSLNPYNPFLTLATAVTRKTESGRVFGPSQRVTRDEALRMMTADAARLHGEEGEKGTLEVGRLGDLAVLSADYFTCPDEEIPAIRSVLTVAGGRVTHRAEAP